jgi:hypothetical protein
LPKIEEKDAEHKKKVNLETKLKKEKQALSGKL